jgi:hypothetical protein
MCLVSNEEAISNGIMAALVARRRSAVNYGT